MSDKYKPLRDGHEHTNVPAVGHDQSTLDNRLADTLEIADLRCEGLHEANQVDTPSPRFSWQLASGERNLRQTAFQLRITEVDAAGRALAAPVESPRTESDATQWVCLPGFVAKPRTGYACQVRAWDNYKRATDWSKPCNFGTGLLGNPWPAAWIGDGRTLGLHQTGPARYFRKAFSIDSVPVRARLFISACGLVEPWLNGRPVTEDCFIPGWPDYSRRFFYTSYDITHLLSAGENVIGVILADGWYSGTMLPHHQFGQEARFSAFIDFTGADGKVITLDTDKDWRWTNDGPITLNSIYHGEYYDARRACAGWCTTNGATDWTWHDVSVRAAKHIFQNYTGRISPPVRRIETLKPVMVKQVDPGVFIYDLGQNMVGWVHLRVCGQAGSEINLRFAEMLDSDGRLFLGNLRTAKAAARYILRGEGLEEWEPRFTYFGFRYVELSGVAQPVEDAITGIVVHTDLPRIGTFTCSDEWLNRLYQNALWSQKGNFLEVPTDCPQRDERLGWSGDAQIFAPTALYNLESGCFYRQWLFSMRDNLRDGPDGGFPDTAPFTGFGHGSAGWGEAGFIIPWFTWLHTGDTRLLAENLPAILQALELMVLQAPDGIRHCRSAWGDWLAPGFEKYMSPPRQDLLATAYFAYTAELTARIADVLGRAELAAGSRALRDKTRAAYQRAYIAADGRVADDVQTSYLITLAFDLAPDELRPQIIGHLLRTIAEKDNHLATGFLGTPLLTPVLCAIGRADLAYQVLQQKTYPGWLLSVKNGATTIWERWDSWTPEEGFNKDGMNSFNHYASGSIVSWFYDTIAGLKPLPESPGWKRFRIAPVPGGGLTSAEATVKTPHGPAASRWTKTDGTFNLSVLIPANTCAEVVLPAPDPATVTIEGLPLVRYALASEVKSTGETTNLTLPSGAYNFTFPGPAV